VVTCGRKEKRQYKIARALNLGKRKKEKSNARTKSLPDLKDNSPDRAVRSLLTEVKDESARVSTLFLICLSATLMASRTEALSSSARVMIMLYRDEKTNSALLYPARASESN